MSSARSRIFTPVLDRESAVPLYRQLAVALETAIHHGELLAGTLLEGEVSMADRLRLSRPTVRRALQQLAADGMLVRSRGKGTLILGPPVRSVLRQDDLGRRQSARVIGVVLPDGASPFFTEIADALQRLAWSQGYLTVVFYSGEELRTEREGIERVAQVADGIVLVSPRLEEETLTRIDLGPRPVLVNCQLPGTPVVMVDVSLGMRQAVAHLAALRHRRIAYVGGPEGSRSDRATETSLREEATLRGCEFDVITRVKPDHAGGYAAADLVLASDATAVIAHNDLVALGLISRMTERSVRVPEDISVVGTGDSALASISSPTLTSVAIDGPRIARAAAGLLFNHLRDSDAAIDTMSIPSHLVVRSSTGIASSRDQL